MYKRQVVAGADAVALLVGVAEEIGVFEARIAVDRGEQHIGAVVEDVLGAVAMVVVDVEDRHPPGAPVEEGLGGEMCIRDRPCLGLAALMFGASASLMAADLPRTKAPEGAKVYFITPADGATVDKTFTVKFGLKGMGAVSYTHLSRRPLRARWSTSAGAKRRLLLSTRVW